MPDQGRERHAFGPQKQGLNRFGRWIEALNRILGTNQSQIASESGISKSTLSLATRGVNGPRGETLVALVSTYRSLAQQRNVALPVGWDLYFVGASIVGDSQLFGEVDPMLATLEQHAALIREREELRNEVNLYRKVKTVAGMQSIRMELEQLRREVTRLKKEVGEDA